MNTAPLARARALLVSSFVGVSLLVQSVAAPQAFRPPAVPLMVHNSYFSVWAFSEVLPQADILNWTRMPNPMTCLVRVDGKSFRLMGDPRSPLPVLEQKSLAVTPTKTAFLFANAEIEVELSFLSPVLVDDLKLLARPVSFVGWKARSLDGKKREIQVYFDIEANIALIDSAHRAKFEHVKAPGFSLLRVGSVRQQPLSYCGDVIPLDWGYCYLGLAADQCASAEFGSAPEIREAFVQGRPSGLAQSDPFRPAEQARAMGVSMTFGPVGAEAVERKVMIGYDASPELQYFTRAMESYWKNETTSFVELLKNSWNEYPAVSARCAEFDARLSADATRVGGDSYAQLLSLLYRQIIGAHHLTRDEGGNPVYFSRENASNSSVNTVDVSFPASPFFLFHSTDLLKSMLVPILDYASHPDWTHDSSPHSIGTFPYATGQRYGGKGSPMPVEETGNMLLMIAGISKVEGNVTFASRYRALLDKWAGHLAKNGYDTGEQLCTDDFRGRQLHNTNLSLKGICGLAAYAQLLEGFGDTAKAQEYAKQAADWAKRWEKEALAPEGTHFLQAFGQNDTWSLKYNMIWDKVLDLGLFAPETYQKEFSFYKSKLQRYGVPMDHRNRETKFDWNFWAACFADDRPSRDLLLNPLYQMVNETPSRLPLTDYFSTETGKIAQFYARSVMGAVWMPLVLDDGLLKKAALRNPSKISQWSPQPAHLEYANLIRANTPNWQFTFEAPASGWEKPGFDDSAWSSDLLPLGNRAGKHGKRGETPWPKEKSEVWLRKSFAKPELNGNQIRMLASYQDEFEVFLNGKKIHESLPGTFPKIPFTRVYWTLPIQLTAADFAEQNVLAIRSKCQRVNPSLNFGLEQAVPASENAGAAK